MLVIRLFRVGKKNQPSFKIVVTDKKSKPRAGRFVEEVGFYNPLTKEKVLKGDRIKHWISVGAKPSPTIFNLLISEKIIEGKKIPKHKKSKKSASSADVPERHEEKPSLEPKEEVAPEKPVEEKIEEPKAEENPPAGGPKEGVKEDVSADLSAEVQGTKVEVSAEAEKKSEIKKEAKEEAKTEEEK